MNAWRKLRFVGLSYGVTLASGGAQFLSYAFLEKRLAAEDFSRLTATFGQLTLYTAAVELGLGTELLRRYASNETGRVAFLKGTLVARACGAFVALIAIQIQLRAAGGSPDFVRQTSFAFLALLPLALLLSAEPVAFARGRALGATVSKFARVGAWSSVVVALSFAALSPAMAVGAYATVHALVMLGALPILSRALNEEGKQRANGKVFLPSLRALRPFLAIVLLQVATQAIFSVALLRALGETAVGPYYFAASLLAPLSLFLGILGQLAVVEATKARASATPDSPTSPGSIASSAAPASPLTAGFKPLAFGVVATLAYLTLLAYAVPERWLVARFPKESLLSYAVPLAFAQPLMALGAFLTSHLQGQGRHRTPMVANALPLGGALLLLAGVMTGTSARIHFGWASFALVAMGVAWIAARSLAPARPQQKGAHPHEHR